MNFKELMEHSLAKYLTSRLTWRQQVEDNAYRECVRLLVLFMANTKLCNYPQLARALARYRSK